MVALYDTLDDSISIVLKLHDDDQYKNFFYKDNNDYAAYPALKLKCHGSILVFLGRGSNNWQS